MEMMSKMPPETMAAMQRQAMAGGQPGGCVLQDARPFPSHPFLEGALLMVSTACEQPQGLLSSADSLQLHQRGCSRHLW